MQLTAWGKRIEKRLSELGKDWEWIRRMINLRGYNCSKEELMWLVTQEHQSQTRKTNIEKLLIEEENRQKFRKHVGFKKLGK